MFRKLLYSLAGLLASTAIVLAAVTLPDGTVTSPVSIYGPTGVIGGVAGVGTETSSSVPNAGIAKSQVMIYNGSAGNLVPMSSQGSSADANAGANMASVGVSGFNGATYDRLRAGVAIDAVSAAGFIAGQQFTFNGTNYDRQRGNFETLAGSLITLATTSANGIDQTNFNGRGLKCTYDVTALTGTSTVLTIQGKDSASGKYYTLLATSSITGTGTSVFTVYPGLPAVANVVANDVLPRVWRVITTNTALTVFTGTIGCVTLL